MGALWDGDICKITAPEEDVVGLSPGLAETALPGPDIKVLGHLFKMALKVVIMDLANKLED